MRARLCRAERDMLAGKLPVVPPGCGKPCDGIAGFDDGRVVTYDEVRAGAEGRMAKMNADGSPVIDLEGW